MTADDIVYAQLARDLADTLRLFARERRDDLKKEIARLQTELCATRRLELAEPQEQPDENPPV
jgi:hypothetical protein